ncbi:MAG: RNA 2',3'-cyclic phosphodiesterase [Desulfobulbaceae bacterium]|uniref:RNA 2',3'-cyclic phosphodiesterase n=1 Tax=Candidatus Desulfatifera sulfidica TaxID=2841691 RepID=A0A8J6TDI7_9BACT|nr:RNA 2',3'-cyclic phosphodiesterase [Candidatus Desulfatifera sulfidica]
MTRPELSHQRLFVSIPIETGINQELNRFQQRLATGLPKGKIRWVHSTNRHITLIFLGDTPMPSARIISLIDEAALSTPPFALPLGSPGAFPSPHRPRVIWLGLDDPLRHCLHLRDSLRLKLDPPMDTQAEKRFIPHLTLGRVRPEGRITEFDWKLKTAPLQLEVKEVQLICSRLTPSGPLYTCLHRSRLRRKN